MPVPAKVELQIVMAASTLLGLDQEPALLRGYGAIPATVAAQIIDSASGAHAGYRKVTRGHPGAGAGVLLRRLICDPVDGRLVGMDTKTRRYTGSLRQFATWRDQGCRLSDASIAGIDHIARHVDGGPTTAANGQALSKSTHVLRDHPQVSVRTMPTQHQAPIDPDAGRGVSQLLALRRSAPDVEWTMPTGQTYRRRPHLHSAGEAVQRRTIRRHRLILVPRHNWLPEMLARCAGG